MDRVNTVGYYVIKQCLIGFITERGESRCSVCAVTMPNCSADKGLKAIPIRGVSEAPPSWRSMTLASAVDWNTACTAGGGMPWLRRVHSPYTTRAQLVIILSMCVVIERLYVRVTPRTEMRWTLSKPCTMGGDRSVCRQDLGLVNTISLDLDRLSLRLLMLAHCSICWISVLQVFSLLAGIIRYVSSATQHT